MILNNIILTFILTFPQKGLKSQCLSSGGRRGIRTPGTVTGSAVFKTAAFDHSAILPVSEFYI